MKKLITSTACFLLAILSMAQTNWTWGYVDGNAKININPIYVQQSVAAYGHEALWCELINYKALSNQQFGDYKMSVYDTSGSVLASTVVRGKLSVIASDADQSGNWYVLGQYKDTLEFTNGRTLIQTPGSSEYCMFRLDAGTLDCSWSRSIGDDFFTSTNCFTIANNNIYLPIDSNDVTSINKLDLATGARTVLWSQTGGSIVTSIMVDSKSNVYLVGSCAFNGINFNGHQVTLPPLFQYPQYIVRYKANGSYDWSQFMQDGTCFVREFTLADDNTIYYTGPLNDSLTLNNLHVTAPPTFGSMMVAQMDSTGHFNWARHLADTANGEATLTNMMHAAIGNDGSVIVHASTARYVNWGNGVTSFTAPNWAYSGTIVAYGKNGDALWAKSAKASYVIPLRMAVSGEHIWVTGNVWDSTKLTLDAINLPLPSGGFGYYPYVAHLKNSIITSLSDLQEIPSFSITPNPASGYFSVTSGAQNKGQIMMAIYDNLGRRLVLKEILFQERIDVSTLPRGLYFIELQSGKEKAVQKLLLQ